METTTETTMAEVTTTVENSVKPILNINVSRILLGLSEIGNLEIEDFKVNYAITRSIANLTVVEKAYSKSLAALQKKYVKMDENGNLSVQNNFFVFNSLEDNKKYREELDKLNEFVVDVKVFAIKSSDLKDVKGLKALTMAKCHELVVDDTEE